MRFRLTSKLLSLLFIISLMHNAKPSINTDLNLIKMATASTGSILVIKALSNIIKNLNANAASTDFILGNIFLYQSLLLNDKSINLKTIGTSLLLHSFNILAFHKHITPLILAYFAYGTIHNTKLEELQKKLVLFSIGTNAIYELIKIFIEFIKARNDETLREGANNLRELSKHVLFNKILNDVSSRLNNVNSEEECFICKSNEGSPTSLAIISCCRQFMHRGCLYKWEKVKFECPHCRQSLSNRILIERE